MTPTEAEDLAGRIAHTWPRSPQAYIWAEKLAELDPGRAGTAYARMRDHEQHADIPKFLEYYGTVRTERPRTIGCHRCDGTGWLRTRQHGSGCTGDNPNHCEALCWAVQPCNCQDTP